MGRGLLRTRRPAEPLRVLRRRPAAHRLITLGPHPQLRRMQRDASVLTADIAVAHPLPAGRASTETRQAPADRLNYNFLYGFKSGCAPLRRARSRLRRPPRSCLRPALRALRRRAPTGEEAGLMSGERCAVRSRSSSASGGGAPTPGWRGRRWRVPAEWGVRGELPSRPPPTQAEPSRRGPGASRSFVQWRAPP